MKEEAPKAESQEGVPSSYVHIELMRHGESNYDAWKAEMRGETPSQYSPDLTPKGVETINTAADSLIHKIKPETDDVFLLTSPEIRAIGSAKLLQGNFEEHHIPIAGNDPFEELGEAGIEGDRKELLKLVPLNYLESKSYLVPEDARTRAMETRHKLPNPNLDYGETFRQYAGKGDLEKIESPRSVAERLKELLKDADLSRRGMHNTQSKRRQFVIVMTHNIFIDPIIETLFGEGLKKGKAAGVRNGESVSCDFAREGDAITFSFRGQERQVTLGELENLLNRYV